MKIVFYLFFVLQVSFGQNGPEPKCVREIPQYHLKDIESGTCLPPLPSGSVNWFGIASSIGSMIPVLGPIFGGMFGVLGNLGISNPEDSEAYGENFNECIKGMIRREITATQLADAKKNLEQIGRQLDYFMSRINGTINENIISQSIIPAINKMYLKVDTLEVLFDSDDDMFMSFKFIGLLLDGLAVESTTRLTFLLRLKELNYGKNDFCRHIRDMRDELNIRYDYFFGNNYLHDELYEGTYSEWPKKIRKETRECSFIIDYCHGGPNIAEVHDDYTSNTTFECHHRCLAPNECPHDPICKTSGPEIDEPYNAAIQFVHETMDNVDKYLSDAKKTHELTMDLVNNLGYDVNCWDDLVTTTTPIPSGKPPPTPPNVGPSMDECVASMGDLHDYFTSEESMDEQTAIFVATLCPEAEDYSSCEEHFWNFYGYAGHCLHDSFFSDTEALCKTILGSLNVENKAKDWTCDWCAYTFEAIAYLWSQQEALDTGLSILHGDCFCGRAQDEGWDYDNCNEEVDELYHNALQVGAAVLIEQTQEICHDIVGVC